MRVNRDWVRRRWFDFRQGHAVYLVFALTIANFVLIFHRLLIERVGWLSKLFPDLWEFALVFGLVYIPAAILVGHWHKRTQLKVEHEVQMRESPFMVKMFRVMLDVQSGNATREEMEEMRKLLKSIEQGRGSKTAAKYNTENKED